MATLTKTFAGNQNPLSDADLTASNNNLQILSSRLRRNTTATTATVVTPSATCSVPQSAQATIYYPAGSSAPPKVFLYALCTGTFATNGDPDNGYALYFDSGTLNIARYDSGAWNFLGDFGSIAYANGQVIRLDVALSGGNTALTCYVGGVQQGSTINDNSGSRKTSGKPGTGMQLGTGSELIEFSQIEYTGVDSTNPTITSTSDDTPDDGTTLTINGTNFGASQGAGTVTANGVGWTVTSWNDTAIQVTVARGTNFYGVNVPLVVTNNAAQASAAYNVQIQPASGTKYITLVAPLATSGLRFVSSPDLQNGWQIAVYSVTGGTIADITLFSDASCAVAPVVTTCLLTVNDGTGWSAGALQTFQSAVAASGGAWMKNLNLPVRTVFRRPTRLPHRRK